MAAVLAAACSRPAEYGHVAAQHMGDLSLPAAQRSAFDQEVVDACGPGGLTEAGAASIVRRPYLQKMRADSAAVLWTARSDRAGPVLLRVGSEPTAVATATPDTTASATGGRQCAAELGPLEPNTVYCYEVRSANDVLLASAGFRTPPLPHSATPIRFVAFGDSGARSTDQQAVADAMRSVPFELMVNTGDVAGDDGRPQDYEETLFEPYASILDRVPFFAAIGNHEYRTDGGRPFRSALPNPAGKSGFWYSFDWGDVHWVFLDTNQDNREQTAWLDADLSANQLPWTIVVLHHAPFSSGYHGGDDLVRETMVPIFEAHRVALVLVGHDHDYERTRSINGVTYIVTGGGGRGTRVVGRSSFTAFSERVAHFVYGELSEDELKLHAIDGMGTEFDSALIRREGR